MMACGMSDILAIDMIRPMPSAINSNWDSSGQLAIFRRAYGARPAFLGAIKNPLGSTIMPS